MSSIARKNIDTLERIGYGVNVETMFGVTDVSVTLKITQGVKSDITFRLVMGYTDMQDEEIVLDIVEKMNYLLNAELVLKE